MQISNSYLQAPVAVNVKIEQKTNLVRSSADTLTVEGLIYMPSVNEMYMQLPPFEQLVTDTVGILVQHGQQRIYKVNDVDQLKNQLTAYLSNRLIETTVEELLSKYYISVGEDPALLTIKLKSSLPQTDISPMEIKMAYDSLSSKMLWIEHLTKRMIPISETDTTAFINKYGQHSVQDIRTPEGKRWFFIEEHTVKITYMPAVLSTLPVMSVSHYLVKDIQGLWMPAERLNTYQVVVY